jgi:hypothetical protein
MRDAEAKRTLLELAAMYDRLAAKTEARLCVASKPREEEQQVAVPDRATNRSSTKTILTTTEATPLPDTSASSTETSA